MEDRILLFFFRLYILNCPPMTLKPYALHRTQQLTNIQALQHSLSIHSDSLDCQSSNLLTYCHPANSKTISKCTYLTCKYLPVKRFTISEGVLGGADTGAGLSCVKVTGVFLRVWHLFSLWLMVWCWYLCRGGMTDHDVIIGINGQPVHTTQEVSDAVRHSTSLFVLVRRKDGDVTLMIIPEETDWYHCLSASSWVSIQLYCAFPKSRSIRISSAKMPQHAITLVLWFPFRRVTVSSS